MLSNLKQCDSNKSNFFFTFETFTWLSNWTEELFVSKHFQTDESSCDADSLRSECGYKQKQVTKTIC